MSTQFKDRVSEYQARVDACLDAALPAAGVAPHRLHEAMRYAVFNGGKRVRPLLVYAAGECLGLDPDLLDGPAVAIELIDSGDGGDAGDDPVLAAVATQRTIREELERAFQGPERFFLTYVDHRIADAAERAGDWSRAHLALDRAEQRLRDAGDETLEAYGWPFLQQETDVVRAQVFLNMGLADLAIPLQGMYSASKHALHGFFGALRTELRDDGVDVMMVCPSFIRTRIESNALTGSGAAVGNGPRAVAGAVMEPEDVARAIVESAAKRERLVTPSLTSRASLWLSRLTPRLYDTLMLRSQRSEF